MKNQIFSIVLFALSISAYAGVGENQTSHQNDISCQVQGLSEKTEVRISQYQGKTSISGLAYSASVTEFSFRDGQILLIAADKEDSSRVRLVISAQLNRKTGNYKGQVVEDDGGNEIQLSSGSAICSVKSTVIGL